MKRQIIKIDENKCDGCGACVPACHEGAIRIVDGKARLSADALCDGLGACLGECPKGAITIEEREADQYSEVTALENIIKEGPGAVEAHLKHLADHGEAGYLETARKHLEKRERKMGEAQDKPMACGCPGSMMRDFRASGQPQTGSVPSAGPSALQQWPVQLKLLNPRAPFFQGADLLVSADCVAFSFANFHQRFLAGKTLVVFCPKLDEDLEGYVEKLSEVFRLNDIKSVTILRMEVPCCGGTVKIVEEALWRSGKNITMKEYTISLRGEII